MKKILLSTLSNEIGVNCFRFVDFSFGNHRPSANLNLLGNDSSAPDCAKEFLEKLKQLRAPLVDLIRYSAYWVWLLSLPPGFLSGQGPSYQS